jgi:tetratricopeptide (TPR) repeat protein
MGKAITALNAGLKYVVSVDGKQLHINSAGFKHLLGKALLGQEDYSAAEKTIRSLVSYYEGIATDDLHLAKLLEDLAMSLLYQGRREQEEAYGYLTRSLKIYETEMMLALRALGTEKGSFYGVNYHAQVYSARLIEDAIAGADVICAIEADATSLPDCPEVFASCESKEEVELGECERAVAELDALLAAPVAIEVFSVKIPHSLDSISRQIDVSRVRYEMGLVLELSERYEDAMMVIEEAHEVLAELTADISGVTEFASEVSHIASLSLVMLKKIVFLERFLVVRDDSHGLISNGDRALTGKVLETPPKRVRSTDKSYRESPDTVIT